MQQRSEDRIETRLEAVWVAGRLDGEGTVRNLSRSGAWIDTTRVRPPIGTEVRVVILDPKEEPDPMLMNGVVVRGSSMGFAVEFHATHFSEIECLVDRLRSLTHS